MEERFIENMAEILEVEPEKLGMDTYFKTSEFEWDSLKGYAMIVMIEEEFDVQISVNKFIEARTVGDLFQYINK
jgi:acyl carrier protein